MLHTHIYGMYSTGHALLSKYLLEGWQNTGVWVSHAIEKLSKIVLLRIISDYEQKKKRIISDCKSSIQASSVQVICWVTLKIFSLSITREKYLQFENSDTVCMKMKVGKF